MSSVLTKPFIEKAIADSTWDLGNRVLYDLCHCHPTHSEADVIAAKVWLIGRSYAAAIERRKEKGDTSGNDEFYERVVVPKIKASGIDRWFQEVSEAKTDDLALMLEVHSKVTKLFKAISKQSKRSLASKYLHFHFPNRYFIYDSRAERAIRLLTQRLRNRLRPLRQFDKTYGRFFVRCRKLSEELASLVGRPITPRELDKVLLASVRKEQGQLLQSHV